MISLGSIIRHPSTLKWIKKNLAAPRFSIHYSVFEYPTSTSQVYCVDTLSFCKTAHQLVFRCYAQNKNPNKTLFLKFDILRQHSTTTTAFILLLFFQLHMQRHFQHLARLVQQATAAQRIKEHRFVHLMMSLGTSTVQTQVRQS